MKIPSALNYLTADWLAFELIGFFGDFMSTLDLLHSYKKSDMKNWELEKRRMQPSTLSYFWIPANEKKKIEEKMCIQVWVWIWTWVLQSGKLEC